ncbi:MAG: hypothetical protein WC998_09910 [Candidatus Paceibacterota bacterium]|jgi:hypothetical protein
MKSLLTLQGERITNSITPGRTGDPSAGATGQGHSVRVPTYVTWSGAVYTVRKRIVFGITSHGIGAEFS